MQIDKHYANTPAAMLVILGGWCGATRKAFRTINPVTAIAYVWNILLSASRKYYIPPARTSRPLNHHQFYTPKLSVVSDKEQYAHNNIVKERSRRNSTRFIVRCQVLFDGLAQGRDEMDIHSCCCYYYDVIPKTRRNCIEKCESVSL